MKKSRQILLLLLVIVFSLVAMFNKIRIETDETAMVSEASNLILQVKILDTKLNEDALKAAGFRFIHFDNIVKTVKALEQSKHHAFAGVRKINIKGEPPLADLLNALDLALKARVKEIEGIKSKVALSRNSGNFLLKNIEELSDRYPPATANIVLQAFGELQGYQLFPTQERELNVQNLLESMIELRDDYPSDTFISNLVQHMQVIFQAQKDITQRLDKMFIPDSQNLAGQVLERLQAFEDKAQNRNIIHRFLMLGILILAGLVLTFVIVKWNRARLKSQRVSEILTDAVGSLSEGFAFFNRDDRLIFWNEAFECQCKTMGFILNKGYSYDDLVRKQEESDDVLVIEHQDDDSFLVQTKTNSWFLHTIAKMQHGGHAIVCVDLTEVRSTQEQLRLAGTVFESASEAMMVTDANSVIQMVNPAFTRITGYMESDVIGQTPRVLSSGRHDVYFYEELYRQLEKHGTWQGEIWNRRKDGEVYPEWLSITTLYNDNNEVTQRVALFTDITSRKKSEERIHFQANYDALTELPNRNLFTDRLIQSVHLANRHKERLALLYLDLDNFKHINDTLGHFMGDQLLCQVAERLTALFRSSDTVARLSGDEFVIIVNNAQKDDDLNQLLDRMLEKISSPYNVDGKTVYTSVSVGATFYPDDAKTVETLMQNADTAMFRAKEMGRNAYCFFTPEMNNRAKERHQLENAMHEALEKEHFVLHYQPIVDPVSQTVISTESLVRWNDPEKGLIPPIKFIPLAEETGLIIPLGDWILRKACQDAADWYFNHDLHIGVSVNLSSLQFKRTDIVALVREVLAETGLPANKLTLEITESLLVDDESQVLKMLREIRDMGVLLSIDDFGTGYSSLSYLKKFPITTLKVDRSFINEVLSNNEDAALTEAILSMARSLNLKVVAEGVENSGQAAFLLERQCDLIQGYYYSKPLPLEDLLCAFKDKTLSA